jgi:Predicted methyltransferases
MRAKAASINRPEGLPAAAGQTFTVAGHILTAPKAAPGLHLVATPIGNLGDITLRALETLAGVDIIACEDTRITRRLTERYAISAQLKPYHEHNAALARPKILERLAQGASIALVSDAGTPLISDPGYKLVREVCAAGHQVTALPGPSSVLSALSVAALPTDRFFFEGFLPAKGNRAPCATCGASADRRHAGDVRIGKPRAGYASRPRRHHGRARCRDLPRNDKNA